MNLAITLLVAAGAGMFIAALVPFHIYEWQWWATAAAACLVAGIVVVYLGYLRTVDE